MNDKVICIVNNPHILAFLKKLFYIKKVFEVQLIHCRCVGYAERKTIFGDCSLIDHHDNRCTSLHFSNFLTVR